MARVKGFGKGRSHNIRPYGDNVSGNDIDCCGGIILIFAIYVIILMIAFGLSEIGII